MLARRNPGLAGMARELGKIRHSSNRKAIEVLGWRPRSTEEAIAATAESLIRLRRETR